MSVGIVTPEGQLTLPKDVRTALGVGPGDRVDFVLMADGHFAMIPGTKPVMSLKGLLPKPAKPVTLEEMERAIVDGRQGSNAV